MLTAARERREGRWGRGRMVDKEERRKGITSKRKSEKLNSKEKWKIKETH